VGTLILNLRCVLADRNEGAPMRVAVIGCGAIGSSVGWHLVQRGVNVTLVDAALPGAGVTNCSFAWCSASTVALEYQRAIAGSPNGLRQRSEEPVHRSAGVDYVRAYFDLGVAGIAAHRDLSDRFGTGEWWHPTGHIRWFDDPVDIGAHQAATAQLKEWGYAASVWSGSQVRHLLEPDVRIPDGAEVVVCPDEGWVEGRTLVVRLVDDATRSGARLMAGCPVTDIAVNEGRVAEIVLGDGNHLAVDAVVNAAGPASNGVASLVGRSLPLIDEPGLIARLSCDRVPVSRAMHTPHVQIRPDGDGRVVLHSRDIDARIGEADVTDLATDLGALAIEMVPALATARPIDARVAWRPIPVDRFPSVGAVGEIEGYYEAVTHGGITLCVLLGRLLADEIVGGNVDSLVQPFRPERLASETISPMPTGGSDR
jgi:glycine/D-amino acid oxidase-like deaminating enzyme